MKSNHIPRRERLNDRIGKLSLRLDDCFHRVGGSFYPKCRDCGATNVQVNMHGHHTGCSYKGLEAEIRHYEALRDGTKLDPVPVKRTNVWKQLKEMES